jgi:hypothetical protein
LEAMLEATLLVKNYKLEIDNILTKINVRENESRMYNPEI